MTAAGPWSVKGIDPKAREIAKDLARRSGLTLGEWLNQIIIDGEVETAPPPFESLPPAADRRRPLDQLYREATGKAAESDPEAAEIRPLFARDESAEVGRVARALETLSSRMEAAEHRSTLAISGIDQSVMGVLSRLDDMDRDQAEAAAQVEEALSDLRECNARVAQRIGRVEQDEGPRLEALKALEQALSRIAAQIQEGEARTGQVAQEAHEEADVLGRRLHKLETAVESGQQTRADIDLISTRLKRVENAFETAEQTRADVDFVSGRLERVEGSLDMAEQTYRAVGALSGRMGRLESGLETAEQALAEVKGVPERLAAAEAALAEAPTAYADAEKVDAVLSRMVERLDRAEARTAAAFDSLEGSFATLDARLRTAESRLGRDGQMGVEAERRFQNLAVELAEKVEASRAELTERIRTAANTRLDRIESAVNDLTGHVQEAEQRSAQAIDSIGREVVRIAENLGERVAGVEIQMAGVVEENLKRADTAQAAAIERLGEEISRIAESLNARVSSSEDRAAETFDSLNARFDSLNDSLAERQDRATSELSDRIRQSEERTAQLLAEARGKLDESLSEQRRTPAAVPPPVAAEAEEAEAPAAAPAFAAAELYPSRSHTLYEEAEFEPKGEFEEPETSPATTAAESAFYEPMQFEEPASPESDPVSDPFAAGGQDPGFDLESSPFDASDEFEPASTTDTMAGPTDPFAAPPPPAGSGFSVRDFAAAATEASVEAPLSTRDMIEQARAAARRASGVRDPGRLSSAGIPPLDETKPRRGLSFPGRRKAEGGAPVLRTVLLASGTAAAITTAAIGAYTLGGANRSTAHTQVADSADASALDGGSAAAPNLAVALRAGGSQAAAAPAGVDLRTPDQADATQTNQARGIYDDAVHRIESGDNGAVKDLRRAANLGYAPAQFYLGRLYEAGGAGVDKDFAEARRWTEKAADGGDPAAMYNLASYYYSGEGGPRDASAAADWFRKAAEKGVVNSQYNLAQLYEKGYGVPQNQAEAYKWYLVAAASGDSEARADADTLKRSLPADAQAAAEQSATQLHAQIAGAVQTASAAR